jgi:Zn-dependent peptidase ImmA (M78 family)
VAFKRGFKAEAERIAEETRSELQLGVADPLDTFGLAAHLGIPVYGLREVGRFSGNTTFVHLFSGPEQDAFSAMTVFTGSSRMIIHNETHATTRQLSNIAHEISHCLLEHPPTPISNAGSRYWRPDVENEASWLGGALLVPREGALRLALDGMGTSEIAAVFRVSEPLCRWRIAQTGIAYQIERRRKYHSR